MSEETGRPYSRDETEGQRLDRHWAEQLQELRVSQAGSQILTGFLLILPFQARFTELADIEHIIYLVLVCVATLAVVLSLAPIVLHRSTFRLGVRQRVVAITHVLLRVTLVTVAVAMAGTMQLVFSMILGVAAGFVAAGVTLVLTAAIWITLPNVARSASR